MKLYPKGYRGIPKFMNKFLKESLNIEKYELIDNAKFKNIGRRKPYIKIPGVGEGEYVFAIDAKTGNTPITNIVVKDNKGNLLLNIHGEEANMPSEKAEELIKKTLKDSL